MDAGAIVLWPEEEDLYTLMCMRIEGGRTAFEREKQNSPINPDLCEWPESYFDETIWFEAWPANLVVKTMALDPSKGSDARRGDYSALVMLGVDRQGIAVRRGRPGPPADAANGGRRRGVVPPFPARRVRRRGQPVSGPAGGRVRGRVPPPGHAWRARPWPLENHTAKQVRIRRLGPYLSVAAAALQEPRVPARGSWSSSSSEFPVGDHDDGPDALEMALRLAAEVLVGRTRQGRPRQPIAGGMRSTMKEP